ncbi:hypothetical protein PanWU01x14_117600 [Parasponia andersonii]|uniref:Uncharacterized protein n=1 Tax=Parasponia andersonii TaxID=3476 RepID=A0A2P5CWP5_PARAD|nr:hypothetical protein PanWU01x14_117600 [Parasponia andersonii]
MKGNFRILWNYQDYWIRLILLKALKTTEYGSQLPIQYSLANQPLMFCEGSKIFEIFNSSN